MSAFKPSGRSSGSKSRKPGILFNYALFTPGIAFEFPAACVRKIESMSSHLYRQSSFTSTASCSSLEDSPVGPQGEPDSGLFGLDLLPPLHTTELPSLSRQSSYDSIQLDDSTEVYAQSFEQGAVLGNFSLPNSAPRLVAEYSSAGLGNLSTPALRGMYEKSQYYFVEFP
jgi:hypothetical protein